MTRRPFVGVSLKMHLSHAQTSSWLTAVAGLGSGFGGVEVAVLPAFTAIATAARTLAGSPIRYGAQDCFWADSGPYTGEVSPAVLRELGCGYVEVGHAERRRLLGEDTAMVARKAAAGAAQGLTPIICVGEPERTGLSAAVQVCLGQLVPVLDALPSNPPVIVAYEPVWAIGATAAAEPARIAAVAGALRPVVDRYGPGSRIIYGGSAGPGVFSSLTGVDGLFLGRSALDPGRFAATVTEVAAG